MSLQIISEVGINHNGDFRLIEELIRQSAQSCADYVKFQLYDSMRVFGDDSRSRNEFTYDQVKNIVAICEAYQIEFFASVFDEEKLEWCEDLGVNRYKIASRTIVDDPDLCRRIVAVGKPTWISLGFWEEDRLPFDAANVKYMNCISKYPTSILDVRPLRPYEGPVVGLSDHSYGIGNCLYNIAHGAQIIEKHFTIDKGMSGNDHAGSMDAMELTTLRLAGDDIYRARCAAQQES